MRQVVVEEYIEGYDGSEKVNKRWYCLKDCADELGVDYHAVSSRADKGLGFRTSLGIIRYRRVEI